MIVDPVVVGDAPLDDALAALVRGHPRGAGQRGEARRAPTAALYAEVDAGRVSVFVRDRGNGFDPATVPDDRRGLATRCAAA